ncbi:MAG: NAD(P)H-hydrate dehydratase [Gammaproteobacteria bacterium]|jgi:NAD(P)H-hydrate epimerase
MTDIPIPCRAKPLYTAVQVRELDRISIEEAGIPGYTLMTRAGEACWQALRENWPDARRVSVVCGIGNNGGDGYIVARLALADGLQVQLIQLGDAARLRGDAEQARQDFVAAGGQAAAFEQAALDAPDVIVDAMLGTGLERPLEGVWRDAAVAINASDCPVLSVDVPSGLLADSGHVPGEAVRANVTVTFIGRKRGLFTGLGPDHAGEVRFDDLGVPAAVSTRVSAGAVLHAGPSLHGLGGPRRRAAHKGDFGHVLVIGGGPGMAGAVRLAGEAALRTGAGLVSLATHPQHAAVMAAHCPELISHAVADARALRVLLARARVVVIGPGLGKSTWAKRLLGRVLEGSRPLVVDADALNLLAAEPCRRDNWVLTPHPGEAGRLLRETTAVVQADRFAAVRALQDRYGGSVVLKGAGSLVCSGTAPVAVCDAGNPGMATAGTGDVLSGVIGGLLAQGLPLADAVLAGVCLHACAGDRAARGGERGLLARDVMAELRPLLNPGR